MPGPLNRGTGPADNSTRVGATIKLDTKTQRDTLNLMKMQQTSIRVPVADLKQLAALAKKEGLQASDLIRRAIREYLERVKK